MAQANEVVVTGAQRAAAKAIMKRDAARGRSTSAAIEKIATAKADSTEYQPAAAKK